MPGNDVPVPSLFAHAGRVGDSIAVNLVMG